MPALVTCRGTALETQWNVGSDDFVLSTIVVVVLSLLSSILVMAALAAVYISPGCPDDQGIPPLLYWSFFTLLVIEIATAIVETVIMSISYRGNIWDSAKRDAQIPKYIYVRLFLLVLEFIAIILCSVATFNPSLIAPLDCSSYRVAIALAETASILVLLKFIGSLLRLLIFLDPCGVFTPGLLQHLSFLDTADDRGEMPPPLQSPGIFPPFLWLRKLTLTPRDAQLSSTAEVPLIETNSGERQPPSVVRFWHRQASFTNTVRGGYTLDDINQQASRFHKHYIGLWRIQRRLRVLFCCLGVGGHRSRGVALQDVARALYTLFDFDEEGGEGVRLVLSDVIAGFRLVYQYQSCKIKRLAEGERLEDKFRMVTFDRMPVNQKPHYKYKPPRPFLHDKPEYHLLVDDMIHYMHHCMGTYGWPLHIFSNVACGLCQLASRTCCKCQRVRSPGDADGCHAVEGRDCCMCGMAAMTIQTGVEREDVLYVSMDNDIYKAPFAVVLDKKMGSVVVSVRGTLSIKDVLTDMSYSMQFVEIDGIINETYIHKGMYAAADEIRQRLVGRTRQEVRLEAIKRQGRVDEAEVDRLMENEKTILPQIFQYYKDYQLIVSGHSLGAGVASVLALLLRKDFPDLHCFAFSPPGCVFSYPLAKYSRKFTTTVVLGNDVVPRISFRSLLYLKQSVKHLLQCCDEPKFNVLFLPKWCSSGRRWPTSVKREESTASLPEGFESLIVGENTTGESLQNAVFPLTHVQLPNFNTSANSRQVAVDFFDSPQAFDREITDHVKNPCGRFMPTFPPGKIFHIRVNKSGSPCCLGYCYPNELEMQRLRNEDLCMIMIDRGAVEDHLPHHVLASLERFKRQALAEHYREPEVERLREKARRERQERREARALSSTGGGWVFPTARKAPGTRASSSTLSSTPDTAISGTPDSTIAASSHTVLPPGVESAPSHFKHGHLEGFDSVDGASRSDCSLDYGAVKGGDILDTTVVEVEIHHDEGALRSDGVSTDQHLSTEREADTGDGGVRGSGLDAGDDAGQAAIERTDESSTNPITPPHTESLKSSSKLPPPPKPGSLFPSLLENVAADPKPKTRPSAIPVRVPFPPSSSPTAELSTISPPPPHQVGPPQGGSQRPRPSRSILRQFSRSNVAPGGRVLTVQSRRGTKLKLIIPPPCPTVEESVVTQL